MNHQPPCIAARHYQAWLERKHGDIGGYRISSHAAEESGEAIGAYNKLLEGRGDRAHLAQEWAQAILMLTIMGQVFLSDDELDQAIVEEAFRR